MLNIYIGGKFNDRVIKCQNNKEKFEIAKKMLAKGDSIEYISEITECSFSEINILK